MEEVQLLGTTVVYPAAGAIGKPLGDAGNAVVVGYVLYPTSFNAYTRTLYVMVFDKPVSK